MLSLSLPIAECKRLQGGSIRECRCLLPEQRGWLDCPPEARGLLVRVPADGVTRHADRRDMVGAGIAVSEVPAPTTQQAKRQSGPTGDCCDECGSFAMQRSGTCLVCRECGASSGGCS